MDGDYLDNEALIRLMDCYNNTDAGLITIKKSKRSLSTKSKKKKLKYKKISLKGKITDEPQSSHGNNSLVTFEDSYSQSMASNEED